LERGNHAGRRHGWGVPHGEIQRKTNWDDNPKEECVKRRNGAAETGLKLKKGKEEKKEKTGQRKGKNVAKGFVNEKNTKRKHRAGKKSSLDETQNGGNSVYRRNERKKRREGLEGR